MTNEQLAGLAQIAAVLFFAVLIIVVVIYMWIPPQENPPHVMPASDDRDRETQWHLSRDGKQYGPFSRQELLQMIEQDNLHADDLLWKPGYHDWTTASAIPGLLRPPLPPASGGAAVASPQATAVGVTPSHQQAIEPVKPGFLGLRRLWHGQLPLGEAFWLYWVMGGIGVLLLAGGFFILFGAVLAKTGLDEYTYDALLGIVALPIFAAAVFYQFIAAVGAWRSASTRTGWGILARMCILFSMGVFVLKIGSFGYAMLH